MWLFFTKGKNRSNKSSTFFPQSAGIRLEKDSEVLDKKTVPDYKQQLVIRQGTEQFKELAKKGLGVKIALL